MVTMQTLQERQRQSAPKVDSGRKILVIPKEERIEGKGEGGGEFNRTACCKTQGGGGGGIQHNCMLKYIGKKGGGRIPQNVRGGGGWNSTELHAVKHREGGGGIQQNCML